MKCITWAAILAAVIILVPTVAVARGCDGIHRCRCGTTQARHFGLPRNYHGCNLAMAREWKRCFPRTSAHAGAVGYTHGTGPTGHVFRIVDNSSGCGNALVTDDRGTYRRNICRAVFVDPNGNYPQKIRTETPSMSFSRQTRLSL